MRGLIVLALLAVCATPAFASTLDEVLDAIRFVESSNRPDVPDGDGGKAIGPWQIHRGYWQDAVAFDKGLGGSYDDCRSEAYARRVVRAYLARYAPAAIRDPQNVDAETVARRHNGGPRGDTKPATGDYWRKVERALSEK